MADTDRIAALEQRVADLETRLVRLAQPASPWPQGHHIGGAVGDHTHGVFLGAHGFIPCSSPGCCTTHCRHMF